MKRFRFRQTKSNRKLVEIYRSELAIYRSKWRAFWSALDEKCSGYLVYDFYWWYIWYPISYALSIPKRIFYSLRHHRQRMVWGVGERDIWSWDHNILEYFYYGFGMFLKQNFGEGVEEWSEKTWKQSMYQSSDRELCNKMVQFRKNFNYIRIVRDGWNLTLQESDTISSESLHQKLREFDRQEEKLINECFQLLAEILEKHHWRLWS